MKRFVALARVSSREQEREGFSLEVQEEALKRYATQAGGEIVKFFKIAETASKGEQRKAVATEHRSNRTNASAAIDRNRRRRGSGFSRPATPDAVASPAA